jgi:hypothetical protein
MIGHQPPSGVFDKIPPTRLPYLGAGYQAGTEVEFQGMIGTYPILPETSGHVVIGIGIGKSGAPGYAGGYLPFTRMAS